MFCLDHSLLGHGTIRPVLTCSLMVISCSIWSIWSFMGALVSSPGTTMEAGSVDGLHRAGLGSMGVVIVAWTNLHR